MSSTNIKPNQQTAILLLIAGHSAKAVAEKIGVTPETVSRWRNGDPAFMAAMNAAQGEIHNHCRDRLRNLGDAALAAISDSLSPSTPPRQRLDAAKFLCEFLALDRPGHIAVGPEDPNMVKNLGQLEREAEIAKVTKHFAP